jgi:hypothetical protein
LLLPEWVRLPLLIAAALVAGYLLGLMLYELPI